MKASLTRDCSLDSFDKMRNERQRQKVRNSFGNECVVERRTALV